MEELVLLSRKQKTRLALTLAGIGACSFWLPGVGVHFAAGAAFDTWHVRIITCLMPCTFLIAYLVARRFAAKSGFRLIGAAMLVGVWLTGGLFITLDSTLEGGAFARAGGVVISLLAIISSIIPIFTCMMAAYDGSLLALLAVTIGALILLLYRLL